MLTLSELLTDRDKFTHLGLNIRQERCKRALCDKR